MKLQKENWHTATTWKVWISQELTQNNKLAFFLQDLTIF